MSAAWRWTRNWKNRPSRLPVFTSFARQRPARGGLPHANRRSLPEPVLAELKPMPPARGIRCGRAANKLSEAILARRATADSTGSTARSCNNARRVLLAALNMFETKSLPMTTWQAVGVGQSRVLAGRIAPGGGQLLTGQHLAVAVSIGCRDHASQLQTVQQADGASGADIEFRFAAASPWPCPTGAPAPRHRRTAGPTPLRMDPPPDADARPLRARLQQAIHIIRACRCGAQTR